MTTQLLFLQSTCNVVALQEIKDDFSDGEGVEEVDSKLITEKTESSSAGQMNLRFSECE